MSKNFDPENFVVLACKRAMGFTQRVIEKLNLKVKNDYEINKIKPMLIESDENQDNNLIKLGILKTSTFPDFEISARLEVSVREKSVHLFQCFRVGFPEFNHDLIELFVVLDLLKRSGARDISLYLPYLPYQRQERKSEGREPISARLIFDLLEAAGGNDYKRLITTDMHTGAAMGFSNKAMDNLITWPLYMLYIKQIIRVDPKDIVIVSPDIGGSTRARSFAEKIGSNFAIIEKRRSNGRVFQYNLIGEINKIAIIIDDIISSGETLVKGGSLLFKKGVEKIYAFGTHGIFNEKNNIPAEKRFYDTNIGVITTDTIPEKFSKDLNTYPIGYYDSCYKWLKGILTLSQYFADALFCCQTACSLSKKMDEYEKSAKDNTGNINDFLIPNQPSEIFTIN